MDLRTEDLRLFVRCVSEGSVSAAARATGIPQAAASRHLQRLEAALGAPVLHRTTRALRPTAHGERLLALARALLTDLDALGRDLDGGRAEPAGEVHVSAPVLLGQSVGGALAEALARRHPALRLHLTLTNARVDLLRDGVDVALRVGALPDAGLLAARLSTERVGAYIARREAPAPRTPDELPALRWIGLRRDDTLRGVGPEGATWTGAVTLSFTSDDRAVLVDAAQRGLGAVLLPTFLGDAREGLLRLLPAWHFGEVPVHAVWLPEARRDNRVRAVVDALRAWSAARGAEDGGALRPR